jgi:hypothetical protein
MEVGRRVSELFQVVYRLSGWPWKVSFLGLSANAGYRSANARYRIEGACRVNGGKSPGREFASHRFTPGGANENAAALNLFLELTDRPIHILQLPGLES